ncbi:protein phosphatase 2C domain-containing protein [Actinospica robiniae]|uniref:protein phosphatase 2C domain-containing protein n=1 Tax=Actinospica robiniae TaxID=304901 RepID=UPI000414FCDA|nr:protein phosphatase 2C domain-containing protein [Actinospica robiniae]
MTFEILDTVSDAGGAKPTEDRIGHSHVAAWVIDGATDIYPEPFLPAVNDVHYLVDAVGAELSRIEEPSFTAEGLLRHLADTVREDIAARGFPAERTHPTCSLGLALDRRDELEFARIGDVTIIAVGNGLTELSTDFYNQREIAAVAAAGSSGLDSDHARQALLRRRREYITGAHAEGVFSGDPDAVLRVHCATVGREDVRHILLCTDGFARAITDYHLFPDWPSLIEAALKESLSAIARAIRNIEHHPKHDLTDSHFKRSDDLAAVLCAPSRSR